MVQALAVGLAFGFLYNVGYTLLIARLGSAGLRHAYIAIGAVVPFVTLGYIGLEHQLPLPRLSFYTVAFFASALLLLFVVTRVTAATVVEYVLMLVYASGSVYTLMLRGALAAEIFDARTLRRVYPKTTAGDVAGVVLSGLLVAPISSALGSIESLLLVGSIALVCALAISARVSRFVAHAHPAHGHHRQHENDARSDQTRAAEIGETGDIASPVRVRGATRRRKRPIVAIVSKRYAALVFFYQLATSAVTLIVQYIVYSEARAFFPAEAELSRFLGFVKAGTTGVSFVFLVFVAGRLLHRFGMPLGLAGGPLVVSALTVIALLSGGSGSVFFVLVIVVHLVDYTLYSGFSKTALQSAFQPLPAHEREEVHTVAQGIGIPLSYGISGLILVAMSRIPGFGTRYAAFLTLAVTLAAAAIGIVLYRAYGSALKTSLARKRLEGADLSVDDASTRTVLENLLTSADTRSVLVGLEFLSATGDTSFSAKLKPLAHHPEPDVRRRVLVWAEAHRPEWAGEIVRTALSRETDPGVVAAAVRALCSISDDPAGTVRPYLVHTDRDVQVACITGLFLYGGINGVLTAGEVFNRLFGSADPDDRISAANVLAAVGIRNFYHPLTSLLTDIESSVVRAAIRACGRVRHPALLPLIVPHVDPAATRPEALHAIASFGADATDFFAGILDGSIAIKLETATRVLRTATRMNDTRVLAVFEDALVRDTGNRSLPPAVAYLDAVYAVLVAHDYEATPGTAPSVERRLDRELNQAARCVLALWETTSVPEFAPVASALDEYYRVTLARVFSLLAFLYDTDTVTGLRRKILGGDNKQRALGVELLDVMLEGPRQKKIVAVMEHPDDRPPDASRYSEVFGLAALPAMERVREIAKSREYWPESWLVKCARCVGHESGILPWPKEDGMLTTIERVMALKSAEVFAGIPDSVLAIIASVGEEIECTRDRDFIEKGELGDCMYVIQEGRVAIHDGETHIADLGPGDVVGEMAVLDPEPRSASARAATETVLLRIDKESFDSVMADYPDLARGVIQVLVRRLRENLKKTR